ncbi:ribonuclease H family protein [Marinilactibacillus sp. XAAS-LB27]|uniref:ribonuclease H family protein n=1 Tax=Marinilactibacillus sp. XAAS-LB27 TaxID=3114538 RepID=UPI002E1944DC|nr:ribonuclease H family protein [Marinilactibacillus sp. XAAS-LB27]
MAQKYYAVKKGRKPGIYMTWPEAQKQISGFSGAEFKSFTTKTEAEQFINPATVISTVSDDDTVFAYVDGSFDKISNRYSYGVVMLKDDKVIATMSNADNDPRYVESFQIAGECFGSLNAIKWAKENGFKKVIVHYDYLGIEMWATGRWRANKQVSKDYITFYQQVSQGIEVVFKKVKAHSGVEFNELVDQLAKDALK